MELVALAKELRRHPLKLFAGALISIAIGIVIAFDVKFGFPPQLTSRQHDAGTATARVLVNTPTSIVADLNPQGGESLPAHAQLLGDLVASDAIRRGIAQRAGINASDLVVLPASVGGVVQTTLATTAPKPVGAATLSVNADPALPVVALQVDAASPGLAGRIANGAVAELQSYISTTAQSENIPPNRRPVITSLGVAQGVPTTSGISPMIGIAAAFVVFFGAAYLIAVSTGITRQLREARPEGEPEPRAADGIDEVEPAPLAEARAPLNAVRRASNAVASRPAPLAAPTRTPTRSAAGTSRPVNPPLRQVSRASRTSR
jgi:hypothetical protein